MSPEATELLLTGCLIELILESKIQIRNVDSKNQLADILTEGHFTRDEWNHLLCLFNISLFSSQSCSDTVTKRPQEGDYVERVVAKSKPVRNLVSIRRTGSSTVPSSTASSGLVNIVPKHHEVRFKASTEKPMEQSKQRNITKRDAVEDSQVRYEDANSMASTGALVGWRSDQTMNSEEGTGRPVTKSLTTEIDLEATEECNILFAESISFKRSPGNELVDKHFLSCGLFTTSSMHAAISHGKDSFRESALRQKYRSETNCTEIVRRDSKKLIREHKLEISRVSELCWGNSTCEKLALADDEEVIQLMKAKVYVFPDSVL